MRSQPLTDRQLLEIMYLSDVEGLPASQIAPRFDRSTNSIVGAIWRINKDTDFSDKSPHLNGSMPERWWVMGLRRREKT